MYKFSSEAESSGVAVQYCPHLDRIPFLKVTMPKMQKKLEGKLPTYMDCQGRSTSNVKCQRQGAQRKIILF